MTLLEVVVTGMLGVAVLWVVLVAVLMATRPDRATLIASVRLIPDVVRLVRRIAADPTVPRGVRARLWLLLGYLVSPIDLIPDFIPLIGYADDAIIIALVLRSTIRSAGPNMIATHWPGTPEGLAAVANLCRMTLPPIDSEDDLPN